MHVAALGLIQVVAACGRNIRDGRRHGDIDADGLRVGVHSGANDNARSTRAHQVQRSGVIRHATGNHRGIQRADELLQVERLATSLHVLSGNQSAVDKQQLRARLNNHGRQLAGVLRGHAHGDGHAGIADLCDALGQQLFIQGCCVQLLQRRQVAEVLRHAGNRALQILVTAPQALCVDDAKAALLAHLDNELGSGQRIGRRRDEWHVKSVGIDVPRGVHILGGTGAASRHQGNLVQVIGAARLAADADFYVIAHC